MNRITNLADKGEPRRPVPERSRSRRVARSSPALHRAGEDCHAPYERCCDDVAERSLSMWQQVLTALDEDRDPGTRGTGAAPSWVSAAVWRHAIDTAAAEGEGPVDIEGRLGVIEDLTYHEAMARHRYACAGMHLASRAWDDDVAGFSLRLPGRSVG